MCEVRSETHIYRQDSRLHSSKRVTTEKSKEMHLSSLVLVIGSWWENGEIILTYILAFKAVSVRAMIHFRRNYGRIRTARVFPSLPLPNKRKILSSQPKENWAYQKHKILLLRRDKWPKATKLRYTRSSLWWKKTEDPHHYQTGTQMKNWKWVTVKTAAKSRTNFCTLDSQVSTRNPK